MKGVSKGEVKEILRKKSGTGSRGGIRIKEAKKNCITGKGMNNPNGNGEEKNPKRYHI